VVQVTTTDTPSQEATSNLFSVVALENGPAPVIYIVQPGDNLWSISRRFGTTVLALRAANPTIPDSGLIFAGQSLIIPSGDGGPSGAVVTLEPLRGAAGTPLQVNASGFPANVEVVIGVGQANGQSVVTYPGQMTDSNGRLATTVAIPVLAEMGQLWTVVIQVSGTPQVAAVSNVFAVTQGAGSSVVSSVPVYLIRLGAGQVGCGDALRAIPHAVPATAQPARAALEALLALDASADDEAGLYNALEPSSLQLANLEVDAQGVAVVELSGLLQLGGVCDGPRVAEQLEQTALQFPAIRDVMIFVNDEPLDTGLSGR
jgi:LysM repeat protein